MEPLRRLIARLLSLGAIGIGFCTLAFSVNGQEEKNDGMADMMLRYAYLTHTDAEAQTAYWRSRFERSREWKVVAKPNSKEDRIRIPNETGEKIIFHAKVLRVDPRVIYIQNGKAIYVWRIGSRLDEALERALSDERRLELKLAIDQDFAKETDPGKQR